MIRTVTLDKNQKNLIKRIAKFQIKCLTDILNENIEIDLMMYCIMQGMSLEKLKELSQNRINIFRELIDNPEKLFTLDDENLSIIRTIMVNIPLPKKIHPAKRSIWNKMDIADKMNLYFHPN